MYAFLRYFAHLYVHSWYRVGVYGEPIPKQGPLLVCCNHTNGLQDAGLMVLSTIRPLRFLAKYRVFEIPVVSHLARMAQAIPVYRKKDGVSMERNQATFDAVFDALRGGEIVAIFPEGESQTAFRLRPPLKTGIARMGLGAMQGHPGLDVRILPLGVHTIDRNRFRSRLELHVGRPLSIAGHLPAFEDDPRAAVPALMSEIEDALREVAPDLGDEADLPILSLARRVWRAEDGGHHPRLALLTQKLAAARRKDPEGADERARQAASWLARLGPEPGPRLGLLAGPIVLAAAALWAFPTLVGRLVARRFASEDKFSTVVALVTPVLGTLLVALAGVVAGLGGRGIGTALWVPGSWLVLAGGIRALDLWRGACAPRRPTVLLQAREFLEGCS